MFIRLFRLVFNIRSPPEITRIQGSLTSESSNRESTPSTPPPDTKRKFLEALEIHYKDRMYDQMWKDYKSDTTHFGRPDGQKSFNDTLVFFLKNTCKCVISLHGTYMDEFLSTKFGESTEGEKKKIMKILFDNNDGIKYHPRQIAVDSTPIIIFYKDNRIKKLVKKNERRYI